MTVFEATVTTDASPQRVWAALVDVTDWPRWTPSYKWVRRLDDGPLRVGSRARVKQPGFVASVWEVTEIDEGREFTWASRAGGVRTVGRHRIQPDAGGGSRIVLDATQTGALAPLFGALIGKRAQRYVELEAAGIKASAEA